MTSQIKTMSDVSGMAKTCGQGYYPAGLTLTYDEMEPYYTAFEMALGVAGERGYFGGKRSSRMQLLSW